MDLPFFRFRFRSSPNIFPASPQALSTTSECGCVAAPPRTPPAAPSRGAPDAPPLRAFALSEGIACATSGNYERFVETSDGTLVGHLFDPRTAQPARSDVLQATAFAPTAAEADAWSTALFVLGPDAGREALAARPGLAAVWVLSTPGGGVRLVPGGTAPQSAGKNP